MDLCSEVYSVLLSHFSQFFKCTLYYCLIFHNTLDVKNIISGSGGLSCSDREQILDAHNRARQSVALGRVPGQPGASNMLEMVRDTEMTDVSE